MTERLAFSKIRGLEEEGVGWVWQERGTVFKEEKDTALPCT